MSKAKKAGDKKKGGGKKGKKKPEPVDPNLLTEVDKTFYELQITDLNRKLARLRTLTQELEIKNEELEANLKTLDEDRNDIIVYLKRIVQEKSDEIIDVQNRLKALEEKRQDEVEEFEAKIVEMEQEYKTMQEQLTSEIKLLNGKLNSLEEFRIQRDDLMKKYEVQEAAMEEQEIRHKREIYEIEKKFIIGTDRLKKEMEDRLLQLSCDFQDATNLRIAATTHRVIRENIAINNELDVILDTHAKLHKENESLKERDRILRMEAELHEAEKNKALTRAQVQYNLIQRLTENYEALSEKLDDYNKYKSAVGVYEQDMVAKNKQIEELKLKNRILEQNLHGSRCDRVTLKTDLAQTKVESDRLTEILVHAAISIKAALRLEPDQDESIERSRRHDLLNHLMEIVSQVYIPQPRQPSLETVASCSEMYKKGDLGFIPVSTQLRARFPTKRNVDTQVGTSLEDIILGIGERIGDHHVDDLGEEEESVEDDLSGSLARREFAEEVPEVLSQVVFDDEPEPPSEASSEAAPEVDLTDMAEAKSFADIEKALTDSNLAQANVARGDGEEAVVVEEVVVEEEEVHPKVSKVVFSSVVLKDGDEREGDE